MEVHFCSGFAIYVNIVLQRLVDLSRSSRMLEHFPLEEGLAFLCESCRGCFLAGPCHHPDTQSEWSLVSTLARVLTHNLVCEAR